MVTDSARDHRSQADEFRVNQQYTKAGDKYTLTAYEYLGDSNLATTSPWSGSGMLYLLVAATCYAMGDDLERCRNRCQQGITIAADFQIQAAEEYQDHEYYDRARRGAWHEYEGEFRLVETVATRGTFDSNHESADAIDACYDRAIERYRDGDNPILAVTEGDTGRLHTFFMRVATGVNAFGALEEFESMRLHTSGDGLVEWVQFKRRTLPDLLAELIRSDEWSWEME